MPPSNFSRHAASRRKPRQQTLEAMLGRASSSKPRASRSSPGAAHVAGKDKSITSIDRDEDEDGDDLPFRRRPPRSSRLLFRTDITSRDSRSVSSPAPTGPSKRRSHVVVVDSEDDGGVGVKIDNSDGDGDDDDDDDDDDIRPAKRRRQHRTVVQFSDDDPGSSGDEDEDDLVVLTPALKSTPQTTGPGEQSTQSRSLRKRVPPSARSARQRHMELLRRRRMGEKVTTSDLEGSSEEDEGGIALYDKDPDHVALSEFEDEEEEEEGEAGSKDENELEEEQGGGVDEEDEDGDKEDVKRKKKEEDALQFAKIMQLGQFNNGGVETGEEDDGYDYDDDLMGRPEDEALAEDDMADFIDDSHVGLIGAPDGEEDEDAEARRQQAVEHEMAMLRREMPLQFTFQAHKPLKSHFKDAVEWLVHRRVNRPTAEDSDAPPSPAAFASYRNDEVYRVAWDRLDREIAGLAQSRFISSTWTPEFHSALRARPYMDSFNLRPGRSTGGGSGNIYFPGAEENVCHACGRTNHPASYRVEFGGKAYNSHTLDDLEGGNADDDEDDEGDGEDGDDNESVDMHGNALPPTSRQWYVGAVCHSNAETAHGLLHWRRALADWVEEKLVKDRALKWVEGGSSKGTKPRKATKRRDYANKVVDEWELNGTINSLFRDFMRLLEEAQAKSTKTMSRYGR